MVQRRPHGRTLPAIQYWVQRETGWTSGHRATHANGVPEAAIQWWSHFGYGTPDERCTDALKAWLKRRYRPKPKTFVESVFLAVMLQVIINVVAAMITEWLLSDREARNSLIIVPEEK